LTIVATETLPSHESEVRRRETMSDHVASSPIDCRETTTQISEALSDLERGRLDLAVARLRALSRRLAAD